MQMRRVRRAEKPKPFLEPEREGWQTVLEPKQLTEAYSNPVRKTILELLDPAPVRKFELTGLVNKRLGKRYDHSVIHHHLKKLERAGLVGLIPVEGGRAKYVYRTADMRVQLRERPKPEIPAEGAPETVEELTAGLRKVLRR